MLFVVMGIKGRRVHMIEELSETIISFQRGKTSASACGSLRHGKVFINIFPHSANSVVGELHFGHLTLSG